MDMINDKSEEFQKLELLLGEIKTGMLTTMNSAQELKSRPMAAQHFDPNLSELWFFTGRASGKVVDIEKNPHVHLSFADSSDGSFLSICGEARIEDSFEKKQKYWDKTLLAWFPEGLEDPNVTLICVKINSAEYWDSSSKFVQLMGYTKAILTGEQYHVDKSEHGRITLN